MILSAPGDALRNEKAQRFCADFMSDKVRPKFVLGRNVYTESVARHVHLAGVIDDFTAETSHLGFPILRSQDVPEMPLFSTRPAAAQ